MGYIKVGLNILPRFKWAIEPTTLGLQQYSTWRRRYLPRIYCSKL